ncbi:hypothetical protein BGZ91_006556 [Linnemannia elongata]|nr:hypothetical protein BGZ91_006556 [Linnemannia elongata]
MRHVSIAGSLTGGREITQEMLEFASKHNVHPWITTMPMSDANTAVKVGPSSPHTSKTTHFLDGSGTSGYEQLGIEVKDSENF